MQRDAAEKRDVVLGRHRLDPAAPERIADLAAMRALVAGHVLDQPDQRHAAGGEHLRGALRVDQRQVLRGGDDHRARRLVLLHHRQLHVSRARRQVDQQQLRLAPMRVDQLGDRVARHRPAPGERLAALDQVSH